MLDPTLFGISLRTELEISDFERDQKIVVPAQLREFLLTTREGGPEFYWEALQHGLLPVDGRCSRLAEDFQWGMVDTRAAILRRLSGDKDFNLDGDPFRELAGFLPLIHYGCAWIDAIVITGVQRGMVWGGGNCCWYPFHDDTGRQFGFQDWYQRIYLPDCSKLRQEQENRARQSIAAKRADDDSPISDEETFPLFRRNEQSM